MKDGARLFAYTTWVIMISLAIIVFTNSFLVYVTYPEWQGLVALLAFGLIYLNFSYLASKRFVRKVIGETYSHFVIALLIFLPPAFWAIYINEELEGSRFIFTLIIAFSCGLGAYYGHRGGRREQRNYLEKQQRSHT